MPISTNSPITQLHVDLRHTSVADLREFAEHAQQRGGGTIHARPTGHSTYTLYVENSRSRGSLARWADPERRQQRELASMVVSAVLLNSRGAKGERIAKPPTVTSTQELVGVLREHQARDVDLPSYQPAGVFAGAAAANAGGATGSKRVKVDGENFQVKSSVQSASLLRRLKAGGLNTENYGEIIGTNVARAVVGRANADLVPEVSLVHSVVDHQAGLSSKYLRNGKGDLDAYYKSQAGKLPKGQKHVRIDLSGTRAGEPGVLSLTGQAAKDMARNLAVSALVGDHDVNPGNMIAVKNGDDGELRIGRIDFGHAFNDLITGIGGRALGGGGVHDRTGNRVLDFFNRETVSGNPLVSGQQTAKLWRDYTGVVPSRHLAEALREMAANNDFRLGLQQARGQIGELVDKLEAEGTPQARKELDEIAASLNKLSANIGKPMSPRSARETVGQLFRNLDAFFEEGRAQMAHVAGLCSLQADIDDYLGMADKDTPEARQAHARLQKSYDALVQSRGTGRALTWMKFDKDTPAFEGDLAGYLAHRQRRLPQAARATMHALA
jgi:hypothetical protein